MASEDNIDVIIGKNQAQELKPDEKHYVENSTDTDSINIGSMLAKDRGYTEYKISDLADKNGILDNVSVTVIGKSGIAETVVRLQKTATIGKTDMSAEKKDNQTESTTAVAGATDNKAGAADKTTNKKADQKQNVTPASSNQQRMLYTACFALSVSLVTGASFGVKKYRKRKKDE